MEILRLRLTALLAHEIFMLWEFLRIVKADPHKRRQLVIQTPLQADPLGFGISNRIQNEIKFAKGQPPEFLVGLTSTDPSLNQTGPVYFLDWPF